MRTSYTVGEYGAPSEPDDEKYLRIFEEHRHEFPLDEGPSLDARHKAAADFTRKYLSGTKYFLRCEEYCCLSTVTVLRKWEEK